MGTTATEDGHRGSTRVGLEVHQDKYLSVRESTREIHAIATVGVKGSGGGGTGEKLAEVLVIDCSSSMTWPQEKFRAAKEAAVAALRMLPDGTPFAVVSGTDTATTAYPAGIGHRSGADSAQVLTPSADEAMPRADDERRAAAELAVHGLHAVGGTSIGSWLDLSRRLLATRSAPIRHVLLLTDGQNVHDEAAPLAGVLDACRDRFVCDCWGIGDDWDAQELLRIANALHGKADSVDHVADLAAAYRALMGDLLAKTVPELVLRVEPSPGSEIRFVKQVYPTEMELTGTPVGDATEYVTRAWGDEERRFQICVTADPEGRPHGFDSQLAVVSVRLPQGAEPLTLPRAQACVVNWTDDPPPGPPDPDVDHFERYNRLGAAARKAEEAYRHGDTAGVGRQLGVAVALAHGLDAEHSLAILNRMAEVDDAALGLVRLRENIDRADFQRLILATTHTTRGPAGGAGGEQPVNEAAQEAVVPCPVCNKPVPASATFCPHGGHPIADPA